MKSVDGLQVTTIESKETPPPPANPTVTGDERYPLSFAFDFTAGVAETKEIVERPIVSFRPEHLVSNLRDPGTATLKQLYAGNIICLLGDGLDLCCVVEADGEPREDGILGTSVCFPFVSPANDICMKVSYSGRFPPGFMPGDVFRVVVTLTGSTKL
jgi:hypothetical protein